MALTDLEIGGGRVERPLSNACFFHCLSFVLTAGFSRELAEKLDGCNSRLHQAGESAILVGSVNLKQERAMPIIQLEGPPIEDLDRKRKLTSLVTEAAAAAYGLPTDTIIIVFKENAPHNVSVGGQLLIDRP